MNSLVLKAVSLGSPEAGAQESVLMIHGFGADRLSWTATAPTLFASHAVWALDLPGHGSSWQFAPATTLSGIAEQLAPEFLRLAKLLPRQRPLHLVGHSLGGALSLLLAQQHPQHVASLSLLAPAGLGAGVNTSFMQEFHTLQNAESAFETLQKLMHNPKLVSQQLAAMLVRQLEKDGVREALRTTARALAESESLIPALASAADKSMLIWGKQDNINPCLDADQRSTSARWRTLEACGHLPHIEHRVKVNQLIGNFIAEHSTA